MERRPDLMPDTICITKDRDGWTFLDQLKEYPCYAGLDLSRTTDLTAFVLAWHIGEKVYCYPWFFLPSDDLNERSKHDGVPYTEWLEQGYLEVCQGSVVDTRYVTSRIRDLASVFKIKEVGFDSWGSPDVVRELSEHNMPCVQ